MDLRKMIPVIAMIGVFVMLVWGYFDSFQYSWLAVVAAGIVIVAISIYEKDRQGKQEK